MPNQRDPRKKIISAYIWRTNHNAIRNYCKANEITLTNFVEECFREKFESLNIEWENYFESNHSNRMDK